MGAQTWWTPRLYTTSSAVNGNDLINPGQGNVTDMMGFVKEIANSSVTALANAALEGAKARFWNQSENIGATIPNDAGIGLGWIKSLLGRSNWTMPCTQYQIAL